MFGVLEHAVGDGVLQPLDVLVDGTQILVQHRVSTQDGDVLEVGCCCIYCTCIGSFQSFDIVIPLLLHNDSREAAHAVALATANIHSHHTFNRYIFAPLPPFRDQLRQR